MSDMRRFLANRFGTAAGPIVLVALFAAAVFAQEGDEEPVVASEELEEIVVISPKPGGRRKVDREYEDPTRARLLKEQYQLEIEKEEYDWRKAAAVDSPSRIKWGYDPRDDYETRSSLAQQDLNWDKTKPATLFRVEF